MMDIKTAKIIKKAINEDPDTHVNVTLADVCRMQLVPVSTSGTGYNVFSLQNGDVTIMVRVNISENLGVYVCGVKAQCW